MPGPSAKGAKTNPHVLVLGGSGAGKTRRLVLPNLWLLGQSDQKESPNSIVITDPKGELYGYTAEYFRNQGYKVRTLNLIHPKRSHRYNPLAQIVDALDRGDTSEASDAAWELAHAFTVPEDNQKTDAFWTNAAQSVVAAAVLYTAARAPRTQRNMASAYRLLTELGQDGGAQMDSLFRAISDVADPARLAYGVTSLSSDRTRAGILTTAAVSIRLFADPSVAATTADSDQDFTTVGKEPTVIYLLLPDDKSAKNAVAALYLQQLYSALSRLASESPGGRLPVNVYFLLDEFANIGKFKDFDKMISVMRGRGMSAMIVLQALQQLTARYGEETAEVITANCDTWLFLKTNDQKTAEEISKKVGQCTIRTTTGSATHRTFDMSTGSSEQLAARPLLTPDEVLRWSMGQVLVLQSGQFPAKLQLADIGQWPVHFAEGDPPVERADPPAEEPWIPKPPYVSPFGRSVPMQVPVVPNADSTIGLSLLERLQKGGSQDDVRDASSANSA